MRHYTFRRIRCNYEKRCAWCKQTYTGPVCPICAYR